jgi:hypothetical protein
MTKNMRESLSRYTATLFFRFNDLTIPPFNAATPFVLGHCAPTLRRDS